jgi:hypothetical protein
MANIFEIASYLEASLKAKGFYVERKVGPNTESILICAKKKKKQHFNIKISWRLIFDSFNTDPFYFVSSFEDADRFIRNFKAVSY